MTGCLGEDAEKLLKYIVLSHFSGVWLCNPADYSPPDSSVHGILQARILEGVAMPSSRGSSRLKNPTCVSCVCWNASDSLLLSHRGSPEIYGIPSKQFVFTLPISLAKTQSSHAPNRHCVSYVDTQQAWVLADGFLVNSVWQSIWLIFV